MSKPSSRAKPAHASLNVKVPPDLLAALDAALAPRRDDLGRGQVVRALLRSWLASGAPMPCEVVAQPIQSVTT